jgi:hypothetical protein
MCPVYIVKLEFKSREELQQMPQTEEEHNIGKEENVDVKPSETNPDFAVHRTDDQDVEVRYSSVHEQPSFVICCRHHA